MTSNQPELKIQWQRGLTAINDTRYSYWIARAWWITRTPGSDHCVCICVLKPSLFRKAKNCFRPSFFSTLLVSYRWITTALVKLYSKSSAQSIRFPTFQEKTSSFVSYAPQISERPKQLSCGSTMYKQNVPLLRIFFQRVPPLPPIFESLLRNASETQSPLSNYLLTFQAGRLKELLCFTSGWSRGCTFLLETFAAWK